MTPPGDLVLLSGGLASTVCLSLACGDARSGGHPSPVALTFDYGQRHRVELDRARDVAAHYGDEHLVVRLDASQWGGSALTDPALAVPDAEVLERAFDVARTLAAGSNTAIRWTKHALNNWLRLAGPSFDTSLALEFLGFKLADAREGLAAARDKRRPVFDRDKPE